jgi:hypothetical protein
MENTLIESLMQAAHDSDEPKLHHKEYELSKYLGRTTVVDALSKLLMKNTEKSLPKIRENVSNALAKTKKLLEELGPLPNSSSVRRKLFTEAAKNIQEKLGTQQGGAAILLNGRTQLSVTRMQLLVEDKLVEDIKAIKMEFHDNDFAGPKIKLSIPPIRKKSAPDKEYMRQVLKEMFQNKPGEGLTGQQGSAAGILALFKSPTKSVIRSPHQLPPQSFKVADRIEATFKGGSTYYPGQIMHVNPDGTYSIRYDDGYTGDHVNSKAIRSTAGTSVPYPGLQVQPALELPVAYDSQDVYLSDEEGSDGQAQMVGEG